MTYVITSLCDGVCDTACVDVCPVDAIAGPVDIDELRQARARGESPDLTNTQLFIDPDTCIGCGACLPECPVAAIFEEDDVPAVHEGAIAANEAFFETR